MGISAWKVEVLYARLDRYLLVTEINKYNFVYQNSLCIEDKAAESATLVQLNALSYRKDP
jgi:hypothetical protein